VEAMLPNSNCGACGQPGCRPFAEALIRGEVDPGECTVCTRDEAQAIADYLGVDVGEHEKRVARLACAGGDHVARQRARYRGLASCQAAESLAGGGKGCAWGCLGLGDCEQVCDFEAIVMDRHRLPVVIEDRCTACGDCVEACPRDLFSLHPVSHRLWVACANLDRGDAAEAECELTCNACGRCVVDAAPGLIEIKNNLAVIDYAKNDLASLTAIERCPTGAIIWLSEDGRTVKGAKAVKVLHQEALPIG